MPELATLTDEQFAKAAIKYNRTRDVFAFSTILSLTYKHKTRPKQTFLTQIQDYVLAKAKKYCSKPKFEIFEQECRLAAG